MKLFKFRREMPQSRRRLDDSQSAERLALLIDFYYGFDNIINVALCVDATWNRQPHELQARR